jgi:nitrite reductase/ring-hydroxylating ferredoxin subunit
MSGFWSKGQTALRSFVNSAFGQQTTRHLVGNADDLKDGQMKEATFTVADRPFKVLLSRIQGQYYATSHLCSHYKARLVTGTLTSEGRLTCPWHAACFNVKTGDIEEAPAIPTLQKYNVIIEDDKIYILAELAGIMPNTILLKFRIGESYKGSM